MYSKWSQQSPWQCQTAQIALRGHHCVLLKPPQSLRSTTGHIAPVTRISRAQAFRSAPPSIGRTHSEPPPSPAWGSSHGPSCPLHRLRGQLPSTTGFPSIL